MQYALHDKRPALFWLLNKLPILFQPDEDMPYDLNQICYLFLKRFNQPYDTTLKMEKTMRDTIFKMEMEVMQEEAKQSKEN